MRVLLFSVVKSGLTVMVFVCFLRSKGFSYLYGIPLSKYLSAITPNHIKAKGLDVVVPFSCLWNYFLRMQKNFAGERTTPDISHYL